MSTGDVYENAYLDAGLGSGHTADFPATVYVALFSTATTDAGGGTELTGGGYVRIAVPNDDANWSVASNGQKSNAQSISFPAATAPWVQTTHFALVDAASGGNFIHHGPLTTPIEVGLDETASFPPGSMIIRAD